MKQKKILIVFLVAILALSVIFFTGHAGEATVEKQYRQGEITKIGLRDYAVVSNKQFIEILEITPDDKLEQVAEVHGMEAVNDLCTDREGDKTYLYVVTGRYLQKYDISDPKNPKVIDQRDFYDWRHGLYKIGYMKSIACDDQFIYVTGSRGMRSFFKDGLVPNDKFMIRTEAFEMATASGKLVIITNRGGEIYDVNSRKQEAVYELKNINNTKRQPAIDANGNIFFPADNSLVRIDAVSGIQSVYVNPINEGATFSYAASVAPSGNIYYVNGYGITKLTNDLKKQGFFNTCSDYEYGPNSWAIHVASAQTNNGERVIIFDKSSLILVDDNLNFLDHYIYDPLPEYDQGIQTNLELKLSEYAGVGGSELTVWAYGFWPNEEVVISLENSEVTVTTDNLGFGVVKLIVPKNTKPGVKNVKAIGQDSNLQYQVTYIIK